MRRDPLSSWIESRFGLERRDGRLVRAPPIPIEGETGGAEQLSAATGVSRAVCEQAIRRRLLACTQIRCPRTGDPVFAFRLHQFLSAGGAAHATPEASDDRSVTMRAQRFVRHERHRAYLPLAFCRACGQEYYVVFREISTTGSRRGEVLVPRSLGERAAPDARPGFLFIDPEPDDPWHESWPLDSEGIRARLPADWFNADGRLRDARRDDVPVLLQVAADGSVHHSDPSDGTQATTGFWLTAPFRFCMRCGDVVRRPPGQRLQPARTARLPGPVHCHHDHLTSCDSAPSAHGRASSQGAQAAVVHRQPPGRLASGRAPERLRGSHDAAGRTLASTQRRRRARVEPRPARVEGRPSAKPGRAGLRPLARREGPCPVDGSQGSHRGRRVPALSRSAQGLASQPAESGTVRNAALRLSGT